MVTLSCLYFKLPSFFMLSLYFIHIFLLLCFLYTFSNRWNPYPLSFLYIPDTLKLYYVSFLFPRYLPPSSPSSSPSLSLSFSTLPSVRHEYHISTAVPPPPPPYRSPHDPLHPKPPPPYLPLTYTQIFCPISQQPPQSKSPVYYLLQYTAILFYCWPACLYYSKLQKPACRLYIANIAKVTSLLAIYCQYYQ